VLIPDENAKDLTEIPDVIKAGLEIIPVARMDDVVAHALMRKPTPIMWEEDTSPPPRDSSDEGSGVMAH
jgi:ATP-dependent Lon protease